MGLLKSETGARPPSGGRRPAFAKRVFSRVDLVNVFGFSRAGSHQRVLARPVVPGASRKRAGHFRETALALVRPTAIRPLVRPAHQTRPPWPPRGRVILWGTTASSATNEPNIGKAATRVLEAAGFDVVLPEGRACCGRPAFSMGCLDVAARFGRHNVDVFKRMGGNAPIIFLEASCYSMFAQDYRELKVAGAEDLSPRCVLFEQFHA